MSTAESQRRVGSTIAEKYVLRRLIGEGGMGAVYEAEHRFTKRRVAVKMMHDGAGVTPNLVERFLREAQVASAIGHPNIVEVLDAGVGSDGEIYMAQTLLEGESAAGLLEREGVLRVPVALGITDAVLEALVAAHKAGVIHRDIKPANVFIATGPKGERSVKLLDFGISKVIAEDGGAERRTLTKDGAVVGTPDYMSPEQLRGDASIDGRTDLWSVGVMLFQMLTGRLPFDGTNMNIVVVNIMTAPTPSLGGALGDSQPALEAVVARALEKDRDKRFANAEQMLEAVRAAVEGRLTLPTPVRAGGAQDEPRPATPSPFKLASGERGSAPPGTPRPLATVEAAPTLDGSNPELARASTLPATPRPSSTPLPREITAPAVEPTAAPAAVPASEASGAPRAARRGVGIAIAGGLALAALAAGVGLTRSRPASIAPTATPIIASPHPAPSTDPAPSAPPETALHSAVVDRPASDTVTDAAAQPVIQAAAPGPTPARPNGRNPRREPAPPHAAAPPPPAAPPPTAPPPAAPPHHAQGVGFARDLNAP